MLLGVISQYVPDAAQPDPDADVVFLSKFDGTDGATSATDLSPIAATITFYGGAELDTTEKKFGTASLETAVGFTEMVRTPYHDAYTALGDGDFTVEWFMRPTSLPETTSQWIGVYEFNSTEARWRCATFGTNLHFQYKTAGGTLRTPLTVAHGMVAGANFYHIAFSRYRNVLRTFVDGVMVGKALVTAAFDDSTLGLTIMTNCDGHGDEFRITSGAWYRTDASFTPPAAEFPATVHGVLSATEGSDAAAFAGQVLVQGILAAIEGADLAAFEAPLNVEGTLSATEGADVAAFTGDVVEVQISIPEGRITLTTLTPVLTATVSAATTIYYTPYNGNQVPLYDGSAFAMTDFAELSQTTSDATKSPAAVTTNSNYDIFVWSDSGTVRCTRGPVWASDTLRGTGAGSTELERVKGILLNKVSITNGPAANRGTYVGTVRSNASSQIPFIFGTTDTAAVLNVWNAYNRVEVVSRTIASVNSFTMVSNSVRSWNNSAVHRASFVSGLAEDAFTAEGHGVSNAGTTANRSTGMGVGYDSTSAISGIMTTNNSNALALMSSSVYSTTALGTHFVQALEVSQTNANNIGYGDANVPLFLQSGLVFRFMM